MSTHACQELPSLPEPCIASNDPLAEDFPFTVGETYCGVLGSDVAAAKILSVTEDRVRFRCVWDTGTSGPYAGLKPNLVLSNRVHEVSWQKVLLNAVFKEEGHTFWAY